MSYDLETADLSKLSDALKSRSSRAEIQAAANSARAVLTKIQTMHSKVESYGKVADDQIDNVNEHMPFYADIQELFTMVPTLKRVSQVLDKMHREALDMPLPPVKAARKSVSAVAQAISVDSENTGDGEVEAGGSQETDAYTMMVAAGLSPAEIEEALAEIRQNLSGKQNTFQGVPLAALGGDGNPGPIPVGMKPAPAAPVLGGGGAGLVPKENNCSFLEQMAKLSDQIPIERVKKQARVMPQAPLEASAQVKKEPGLSAAQIAQAATDNAAQQGLSNTINLVDSDDE